MLVHLIILTYIVQCVHVNADEDCASGCYVVVDGFVLSVQMALVRIRARPFYIISN